MKDSDTSVQPGISDLGAFYMSLNAEATPGVPPAGGEGAGEGGDGQGGESQELDPGLYPGIEQVPSDVRQHLDPILLEINKNANEQVSKVNQQLDAWKPYEELGVRDAIDPETMQGLLGFVEMLGSAKDDPAALQEWWEALGNEFEFGSNGDNGAEEEELFGEDFGEGESNPQEIKDIVAQAVQEQLAPYMQQQQQSAQQAQMQTVEGRIDDEFGEIINQYGQFSDDPEKNEQIEARIIRLALPYANENDGQGSILKGFEEYQNILKDGEGQLFQEVSQQPSKPEGPGTPDTHKEKPTDMKDAEALARERLSQS